MDPQKIEQLISQTVPETKATRIVYFPITERDSIPHDWKWSLIKRYGRPVFNSNNVEIWNIPPSNKHVK